MEYIQGERAVSISNPHPWKFLDGTKPRRAIPCERGHILRLCLELKDFVGHSYQY